MPTTIVTRPNPCDQDSVSRSTSRPSTAVSSTEPPTITGVPTDDGTPPAEYHESQNFGQAYAQARQQRPAQAPCTEGKWVALQVTHQQPAATQRGGHQLRIHGPGRRRNMVGGQFDEEVIARQA